MEGRAERMLHTSDLVAAWRRAQLAEVAFCRGQQAVDVAVVVPLVENGRPCVALSYDRLALARSLDAADEVVLAVAALAGDGPAGIVRARAHVVDEVSGDEFVGSGLIEQELAKHPPSRRRIDSIMLRREHWWLLPRVIVRFGALAEARGLEPNDALIAVADDRLEVTTCGISEDRPDRLNLTLGDAPPWSDATGRRAVVLEHGADVPDLERPWHRRWHGQIEGDRLLVERSDQHRPPTRAPSLLERWRQERVLERCCRHGLRNAGIR